MMMDIEQAHAPDDWIPEGTPFTEEVWRQNDERPRPLNQGDRCIFLGKAFFLRIDDRDGVPSSLTIHLQTSGLGPHGWERLEQAFANEGFLVTYVWEEEEEVEEPEQ